MSIWAVMASPLIISANIRNISSYVLETYLNPEVIAVNQDVLAIQGHRVAGDDLSPHAGSTNNTNVWVRKLTGGRYAFVFLNADPTKPANITCDEACMIKTLGADVAKRDLKLRDLWMREDLPGCHDAGRELAVWDVPPNGGHEMLLVTPSCTPA